MRRALCVGIDQYPDAPLHGCVNDANRMAAVLAKNYDGSPNFDCIVLDAPAGGPNDAVTRAILRKHLEQLFKDPADVALFFFAGHGSVNNLGGYLMTQDAEEYDEGVALQEVLRFAKESKAHEVVVLLDSCFSGSMGSVPAVDEVTALLREGISILTASRGDQVSLESGGGGVFTSLVVEALDGGAANVLGSVTAAGVYAFVEAALGPWDQRPMFKAHVSRMIELRCATPPIAREILRRLPILFPLPAEDLLLDPSWEPKSENPDPANTLRFADLQALSRLHLVTPIGTAHMYDAAMQSTGCRLTLSGRHYWRLARGNRI